MTLLKFILPFFTLFHVAIAQAPIVPIQPNSQNMVILGMGEKEIVYTPVLSLTDRILQEFDDPIMLEIAKAESRLNPKAYNPEWHYKNGEPYCQGSYGIFQTACINYDGDPNDLFDIDLNIQVAKRILREQGLIAWGVCHGIINCIRN